MTTLLCIAVGLLGGLLMTRILKRFNMPVITSYLIAGLLLGPFFIGRLGIPGIGFNTYEQVEGFGLLSDIALGFIALTIGNEFRIEQLKKIGKQATIVGILQAVITTIIVDIALIIFHCIRPDVLSIPAAITLGAIAAATAPAATLMVVRQYKAKGPITEILLPVVALDDAVGLIVFSFSFGIAKTLQSGVVDVAAIIVEPLVEIVLSILVGFLGGLLLSGIVKLFDTNRAKDAAVIAFVFLGVALAKEEFTVGNFSFGIAKTLQSGVVDVAAIIVEPLVEIVLSLLVGFLGGLLLSGIVKLFDTNRAKDAAVIAFVFLGVALAKEEFTVGNFAFGLSPLLLCMMLGATFCNVCKQSTVLMNGADEWEAPLLIIFFVLSGAELNLHMLSSVTVIVAGLVYIISRSLGKYLGAYISCTISKCEKNVVKYLGVTLLPQAGVALGMSSLAMTSLPGDGELVRSITLFGVLIFELIAPTMTRIALTKAGEIKPQTESGMTISE